ncbi:MAG: glycosyltransferase [Lachnospiraceae bacterium]|nr:glycosyltransferase [Lachnospiraceae bacterium]
MKKVSLILTTYNSKDNLEKTLNSIEKQDYPNIEVVIKDGGSTDGTLDVIREYQEKSKLAIISVSKSDKGIYDAMNQGYELSSGDVIVFFNDVFSTPDVVSKMVKKMESINPDTGEEYVGAHADLVYVEGDKVIRKWHMGEGNIYQGWMPGHPTLFLKREIYEKYGLYRTDFKIAADYEFMVRFLKDKANKLAYLPETVIEMFYGGTSTVGLKSYIESFKEGYRALKINGIGFAFWITCFRTLRVLRQFVK